MWKNYYILLYLEYIFSLINWINKRKMTKQNLLMSLVMINFNSKLFFLHSIKMPTLHTHTQCMCMCVRMFVGLGKSKWACIEHIIIQTYADIFHLNNFICGEIWIYNLSVNQGHEHWNGSFIKQIQQFEGNL